MAVEKKTSVIYFICFILFDNEGNSKAVLYIALNFFQLLNNMFPVESDRNINNFKATHGPHHKKDPFPPS